MCLVISMQCLTECIWQHYAGPCWLEQDPTGRHLPFQDISAASSSSVLVHSVFKGFIRCSSLGRLRFRRVTSPWWGPQACLGDSASASASSSSTGRDAAASDLPDLRDLVTWLSMATSGSTEACRYASASASACKQTVISTATALSCHGSPSFYPRTATQKKT